MLDTPGLATVMHRLAAIAFILAAPLITVCPALAQDFPAKPLRMIVPYPPGGSPDINARLFAGRISETLKQPVLAENRPGAESLIGVRALLQAPADGYTLLHSASLTIQILSIASKSADFKYEDFRIVGVSGMGPTVLSVSKTLPVKNIAELVAYAKANPGVLNYGTTATTLMLLTSRFMSAAGITGQAINYKGSVQALTDMAGGRLHMYMDGAATSVAQYKQGSIQILGVAGERRMASNPEIPTFKEQGFPSVVSTTYLDFFVPAKTPDAAARRLTSAFSVALADAGVRKQLDALGREPWTGTIEEYIKWARENGQAWSEDIRRAGIQME